MSESTLFTFLSSWETGEALRRLEASPVRKHVPFSLSVFISKLKTVVAELEAIQQT
jgi:hypothetical protein